MDKESPGNWQVHSWMIWDAGQALDPDKADDGKDLMSASMKTAQLAEADAPLEEGAGNVWYTCLSPNVSDHVSWKLVKALED